MEKTTKMTQLLAEITALGGDYLRHVTITMPKTKSPTITIPRNSFTRRNLDPAKTYLVILIPEEPQKKPDVNK